MTENPAILFELAGFAGVALRVGASAALQGELIPGNGYAYATLNLVAAAMVLISLTANFNLWSAIIQTSWITISIVGMTRVWILTRNLRFSAEEQELLNSHLTGLRRIDAHRIVRSDTWRNADAGERLTREGEPVTALCFIAEGGVDVSIGGKSITGAPSGELIGEMACLSKVPASATVTVNRPSRYFRISPDAMLRLCQRNPDLRPLL